MGSKIFDAFSIYDAYNTLNFVKTDFVSVFCMQWSAETVSLIVEQFVLLPFPCLWCGLGPCCMIHSFTYLSEPFSWTSLLVLVCY